MRARQIASFALLGSCLAASAHANDATSPAASKPPALDGWLHATYGAQAQWSGDWSAPGKDDEGNAVTVKRRICVDSGPQTDGRRYLAVCGDIDPSGHPTPGITDLWILQGGADGARALASRRDIASGSMGGAGDVRLLRLGPDIVAFGVHSGFYNMGEGGEGTDVYVRREATLDKAFAYRSGSSDNGTGAMAGGQCKEEADCERRFGHDVTCTLEVDRKGKVAGDYYPLTVHAHGTDKGRVVSRDIAVPMQGGKPAPDAALLARAGCGSDDE